MVSGLLCRLAGLSWAAQCPGPGAGCPVREASRVLHPKSECGLWEGGADPGQDREKPAELVSVVHQGRLWGGQPVLTS